METSFNRAAGQGQSPISPAPSTSPFQANVNRKKTRKWVEAKVQSYDGDDWGTPEDESDEESDSPEPRPPVPRPNADYRLPSETRVPGSGRPGHVAAGSTSSNVSRPLSIQTQKQIPGPGYSDERSAEGASSAVTATSTVDPSTQHTSEAVVSPLSERGQPLARPADIYRRMEEEKQNETPVEGPTVGPAGATQGAADEDPSSFEPKRVSVSPQLPDVARMSSFGPDLFAGGQAPSENKTANEPLDKVEEGPSVGSKEEGRPATERDSAASGPMLPSTTFTPPTSAKLPAEPETAAAPQENIQDSASHPTPRAHMDEPEVSSLSDHDNTAPEVPPGLSSAAIERDSQDRLQAGTDPRSLPPLRTPSPHKPRTVPPPVFEGPTTQPASSAKPSVDITPTEPLQPKKPERSPSDYEPLPLERQVTLDTVTSSPVKESDVLSEEILRTLTPGGGLKSHLDNADDRRESPVTRTGRESSYTLSGYDDYWADTSDKDDEPSKKPTPTAGLGDVPEHPPVPSSATTEPKLAEHTPVSPESSFSPVALGGQRNLRRKFSWEAEDEAPKAAPPPVSPPSTIASPIAPYSAHPPPATMGEGPQPAARPGTTSPTIQVVPETGSISHQVSQASSAPAPAGQSSSVEPPSPMSEPSDRDATPLAQSPGTGPGNNSATLPAQSPVSGIRQVESPTAPTGPSPVGQKILTFREIMSIPATADRIEKYSETRKSFASQDSGLDKWLEAMLAEHPNASASFSGAAPPPPSSANAAQETGQQAAAQQPYFQQYLNASAPASGTAPGRSRLAGLPQQAQVAAGSAFGHGGKEIGTKSKELMHSAGKMGKGLFSKGKSKLRGTGDKDDTSPPSVDAKPQKADRRTSWVPSLGQKSRTFASVAAPLTLNTSSVGDPPRLDKPPVVSPLLTEPSASSYGEFWPSPAGEPRQSAPATFGAVGNLTAGPGDRPNASQSGGHAQTHAISDDWVVVPRQDPDQRDTLASAQNADGAHSRAAPTVAVHQDSGVAMASQPDVPPAGAQRHSSFKGLPPIRRNSSFGLSSIDVLTEVERRASIDDTVPTGAAQNGAAHQQDQAHANQPEGILQPADNSTDKSMATTLVGQESTGRTDRSSLSQKEPMRYYEQPGQPPPSRQPQYDPSVPSQLYQDNEQPPTAQSVSPQPPSGWGFVESHLSEPLHAARRRAGTGNSMQQPPPSSFDKETGVVMGPLSPEDSAPGPAPWQAPITAPTPGPASGPGPQQGPPRARAPDVPPSSARRYPELFRPAGQPQQHYGYPNHHGQPVPGHQPYNPRASFDVSIPMKPEGADHEATQDEDRGRRKSSGVFKGIGDRIRSASRGRRSSMGQGSDEAAMHGHSYFHGGEEPQEPKKKRSSFLPALRSRTSMDGVSSHRPESPATSPNFHGEEAQEPKKKRSSFLPALRSRTSMDGVSSHRPDSPARSQTSFAPEGSTTSKSEKKKSFLGAAAGKMSAAQQKFIPGGISRSSTGLANNGAANSSTGVDESANMGPPKKRFSGFTDKAAGFTSRFRPGQDGHQKSGTANTRVPSTGGFPPDPAGSQTSLSPPPKATRRHTGTPDSMNSFGLPPPPSRSRDRSGSGGSFGMAPPPAPGSEQERRGRRGSFTGIITNFMGRSSSKTRQSQEYTQQPPLQNLHHQDLTAAPSAPVPPPPIHRELHQQPGAADGQGRPPLDPGLRAARHLSGGLLQAPRPSPLAQETSVTGPEAPSRSDAVRSPSVPSEHQPTASSTPAPSEGRVSPMPVLDYTQSPRPSVLSVTERAGTPKSPAAAPVAPAPAPAPVEEQVSRPQADSAVSDELLDKDEPQNDEEPTQPPAEDEPPIVPVRRRPTPHASALLSSAPAADEPQPPVPSVPGQQLTPMQPSGQAPRKVRAAGHERTETGTSEPTQQAATEPPDGLSREGTPAERQPPQHIPGASEPTQQAANEVPAGPSREGTPADAQPQEHDADPARPYSYQQPPQHGPASPSSAPAGRHPQHPPNHAPGHPSLQGLRQPPSLKHPQNRPNQNPGHLDRQGFRQAQGPPRQAYGQPPGPPPGRVPPGQFPPQQLSQPAPPQGFGEQGVPAQGPPSTAESGGQEPKWKSLRDRISTQVANIAPSTSQEKPSKPEKEGKPGWKNRISGQLSQAIPQGGQNKPEKGDKPSTGGKLLGALKKVAKTGDSAPSAPQPPPKDGQQGHPGSGVHPPPHLQQQQQRRPGPEPQFTPTQHPNHPGYGQLMYQGPPGPPSMASAQYQQYQQQQYQQYQHQLAQWAAAGRPGPPPQQWSYGQQMGPPHHQQHVQQVPEPQYGIVPIPKSYSAVHGEGIIAPTNYHVGGPTPPLMQQTPYAPQQGYYHTQGQTLPGQPHHASTPSPPTAAVGPSQQIPNYQPAQQGTPQGPDSGTQGTVPPGEEPLQRPPNIRQFSAESGPLGGTDQRRLPPGDPQHGHLHTRPSTTSLDGQVVPVQPSRVSSQVSSRADVAAAKQDDPPRAGSLSPEAMLDGKNDASGAKDLSVDVEKSRQVADDDIYGATPDLKQDKAGVSKDVSDMSKSNSNGSASNKPGSNHPAGGDKSPAVNQDTEAAAAAAAAHVELEDTAEARLRTLRLNSQEEKIFYDPEGDIPKMSATSYPGQEWNPYGEPEFADFRDE